VGVIKAKVHRAAHGRKEKEPCSLILSGEERQAGKGGQKGIRVPWNSDDLDGEEGELA